MNFLFRLGILFFCRAGSFCRVGGICLAGSLCLGQSLATLQGTVVLEEQRPAIGARVSLLDHLETLTDSQGRYTLSGVPVGDYTLKVEFRGYPAMVQALQVRAGLSRLPATELKLSETEETMRVIGSLRQGQAAALLDQRLANTIKSVVASDQMGTFADGNAAEATQRLPGVGLYRDQGEGRYVLVRGTESRLNKSAMNGMDLPAPEGDLRNVALDVIPLDLLQGIEVIKAVTADLDGDSVGGTVNMITQSAASHRRLSLALETGYTQLAGGDILAGNLTFGTALGNHWSVLASLNSDSVERDSDNFEAVYDEGQLEELEIRDYSVERKRIGALTSLRFDPSGQFSFELKGSYSQFDDQEYRRRVRSRLDKKSLERELKDRFETQMVNSLQAHCDWFNASGGHLELNWAHGYAHESEPERLDTTFVQKKIQFSPDTSDPYRMQTHAGNEDLSQFVLDDAVFEHNFTSDRHNTAAVDYEWSSFLGEHQLRWKLGAKYREKVKMRDMNATIYSSSEDVYLLDVADLDFVDEDAFSFYPLGTHVSPAAARSLLAQLDEQEIDHEADSADYRVEEKKSAAYAMATLDQGPWMILAGLRLESIEAEYTGYEVRYLEDGSYDQTLPLRGGKDDSLLLPSLHFKHSFSRNHQLRGALTRSYARANVYDQVPYRLVLEEDLEIVRGNPEIEMTTVWNADLSWESYLSETDLFSLGIFYKDMADYIYILQTEQEIDGATFQVTQPLNGPEAKLFGIEMSLQKSFSQLPGWWSGFGLFFNATYTHSKAQLEGRQDIQLPGQAEKTANLALLYEKAGFSLRLSTNLHDEFSEALGEEEDDDIYVARHLQWDAFASYQMKRFKLFLELINLKDEPFLRYQGDTNHPLQYESYQAWGRLGLKFEF